MLEAPTFWGNMYGGRMVGLVRNLFNFSPHLRLILLQDIDLASSFLAFQSHQLKPRNDFRRFKFVQALGAASKTVEPALVVHSLHSYFVLGGISSCTFFILNFLSRFKSGKPNFPSQNQHIRFPQFQIPVMKLGLICLETKKMLA